MGVEEITLELDSSSSSLVSSSSRDSIADLFNVRLELTLSSSSSSSSNFCMKKMQLVKTKETLMGYLPMMIRSLNDCYYWYCAIFSPFLFQSDLIPHVATRESSAAWH